MSDDALNILNHFIASFDFTVISSFVLQNYKILAIIIAIVIMFRWLKEVILILCVCIVVIITNDKKLQNKTVDMIKAIIHKK